MKVVRRSTICQTSLPALWHKHHWCLNQPEVRHLWKQSDSQSDNCDSSLLELPQHGFLLHNEPHSDWKGWTHKDIITHIFFIKVSHHKENIQLFTNNCGQSILNKFSCHVFFIFRYFNYFQNANILRYASFMVKYKIEQRHRFFSIEKNNQQIQREMRIKYCSRDAFIKFHSTNGWVITGLCATEKNLGRYSLQSFVQSTVCKKIFTFKVFSLVIYIALSIRSIRNK